MSVLVLDHELAEELKARRIQSGSDRWDEVWEGVYVMSPLPNNEHQALVARWVFILETVIGVPGLGDVFPGVNVSDRDDDWTQNYRCPDLAVFLRGGTAQSRETHWLGGPDFAIEITSVDDRIREKMSFYERVRVRELLVIDRNPWTLELHRLEDGRLVSVGRSSPAQSQEVVSAVIPLSIRLVGGDPRPRIEVAHSDGQRTWSI